MLRDARRRSLALLADLEGDRWFGPRLAIINPLLWELGHVGWFQERWILRHAAGRAPLRAGGDSLYDSSAVPHDTRWDLPLPAPAETRAYVGEILDRAAALAAGELDPYFARLAVFHEDMHAEAFAYTRQTLGYPAPAVGAAEPPAGGAWPGDVEVPGGRFRLGTEPDTEPFVFDNEKWAHTVEVRPFRIARAPVTQGELAAFVDDGGYAERRLWSEAGWRWREAAAAEHPIHWRRDAGRWLRRAFDRWVPLEPHRPAIHVSWHEADAWCRWAGRRLPTELEWEVAAAGERDGDGLAARKRRFPWGDALPSPERAALDFTFTGCADVAAFPAGDSAFGCRQMMGNVWEWTASDFGPYPGFAADPYEDYSRPWFGTHKVLRGGCFVTRGRLLRNSWRNFYTPDRADVWAGFRTAQAAC